MCSNVPLIIHNFPWILWKSQLHHWIYSMKPHPGRAHFHIGVFVQQISFPQGCWKGSRFRDEKVVQVKIRLIYSICVRPWKNWGSYDKFTSRESENHTCIYICYVSVHWRTKLFATNVNNPFRCNILICPHFPLHVQGIHKWVVQYITLHVLCNPGDIQEWTNLFTFARVGWWNIARVKIWYWK